MNETDIFDGMGDWEISEERRAWKDESQQMWPIYRGNGRFEFKPGIFVLIERITWSRFSDRFELFGTLPHSAVNTW